MYSEFFGHYLLSHDKIDKDIVLELLKHEFHPGQTPPFKAVYHGYLSNEEYVTCLNEAIDSGKPFYDLVIEHGYMDAEQVSEITAEKEPVYMQFAQYLIDKGTVSPTEMSQIVADYVSGFELVDLDFIDEMNDAVDRILHDVTMITDGQDTMLLLDYYPLLFNDLIRYIGDDFTPLSVQAFTGYVSKICAKQDITSTNTLLTAIDMDENTAIEFATRFSSMEFTECDEYVDASLCDFLNQHNGLFAVNMANEHDYHLSLAIPESANYDIVSDSGTGFLLSVSYSFGVVNFFLYPH